MEIDFFAPELSSRAAPLGKRALSFLIDLLIFYFAFFNTTTMIFLNSMGIEGLSFSILENESVLRALEFNFYLNTLLFLMYLSFFEFAFGQTLGKRIMRISVDGASSFRRALARNLSVLFPLFAVIDLFPLVNSNQRLLERLSRTQVLYRPELMVQEENML